ncbi:MAG: thrombospondin type 3 repeat-containing protein, partial [Candidatus Rokuibacteriota bacterium]
SNSWNAFGCCGNAAAGNVNDVGFIRAVVEEVSAMGNIDHRRVYATGLSNGGAMTHRLACQAADVFAAAAPVSFPLNTSAAVCRPSRRISVTHFHGYQDMTVHYVSTFPLFFQGAQQSFATWAGIDGCVGSPVVLDLGAPSMCETYTSCLGGAQVALCSLQGPHVLYPPAQNVLDIAEYAWTTALSPHALGLPDADGDGWANQDDNCTFVANADQVDVDLSCVGDACEACPNPTGNDLDGDGVCGNVDNCPTVVNAGQENFDGDARGDACDSCPTIVDDGTDSDSDGVGQACDTCIDKPNPRFTGNTSNRTLVSGQLDDDADGRGNACDMDYNQGQTVVGAPDTNLMVAALTTGRSVNDNLCGPSGTSACGIHDHNQGQTAIGAPDTNLLVGLLNSGNTALNLSPNRHCGVTPAALCSVNPDQPCCSPFSRAIGSVPGPTLGKSICQDATGVGAPQRCAFAN